MFRWPFRCSYETFKCSQSRLIGLYIRILSWRARYPASPLADRNSQDLNPRYEKESEKNLGHDQVVPTFSRYSLSFFSSFSTLSSPSLFRTSVVGIPFSSRARYLRRQSSAPNIASEDFVPEGLLTNLVGRQVDVQELSGVASRHLYQLLSPVSIKVESHIFGDFLWFPCEELVRWTSKADLRLFYNNKCSRIAR
jgi:hypothetical protein